MNLFVWLNLGARNACPVADRYAATASAAVQAEVDAAYQAICQMWAPNAVVFKNLGQMYVDDPRFTATYDQPRRSGGLPRIATPRRRPRTVW